MSEALQDERAESGLHLFKKPDFNELDQRRRYPTWARVTAAIGGDLNSDTVRTRWWPKLKEAVPVDWLKVEPGGFTELAVFLFRDYRDYVSEQADPELRINSDAWVLDIQTAYAAELEHSQNPVGRSVPTPSTPAPSTVGGVASSFQHYRTQALQQPLQPVKTAGAIARVESPQGAISLSRPTPERVEILPVEGSQNLSMIKQGIELLKLGVLQQMELTQVDLQVNQQERREIMQQRLDLQKIAGQVEALDEYQARTNARLQTTAQLEQLDLIRQMQAQGLQPDFLAQDQAPQSQAVPPATGVGP